MNAHEFPARKTILKGGKRVDKENYFSKINKRCKELTEADRPASRRDLLPGEENQLMLPGVKR